MHQVNKSESRVQLGVFHISKQDRKVNLQRQFKNIDQSSFDVVFIPESNKILVFAAYSLLMINLDDKISTYYVFNSLFNIINRIDSQSTPEDKTIIYDRSFIEMNLDLRGGSSYIVNQNQ